MAEAGAGAGAAAGASATGAGATGACALAGSAAGAGATATGAGATGASTLAGSAAGAGAAVTGAGAAGASALAGSAAGAGVAATGAGAAAASALAGSAAGAGVAATGAGAAAATALAGSAAGAGAVTGAGAGAGASTAAGAAASVTRPRLDAVPEPLAKSLPVPSTAFQETFAVAQSLANTNGSLVSRPESSAWSSQAGRVMVMSTSGLHQLLASPGTSTLMLSFFEKASSWANACGTRPQAPITASVSACFFMEFLRSVPRCRWLVCRRCSALARSARLATAG